LLTVNSHEHGRPSARAGKDGNAYASQGHEVEENLKRFARQAAAWLEQKVDQYQIPQLALFAPPRFLGALRPLCPTRLNGCLRQYEADLTNHSAATLSRHPAIQELVGPHALSADTQRTPQSHQTAR
jgi:protein required for attachment to host cells